MTDRDITAIRAAFAKREALTRRTLAALNGHARSDMVFIILSWMPEDAVETMLEALER